jgi:hypothetical protein
MIAVMAGVEHILLESDERNVPTLETARKVHARIALPGDRWRPALELALIDYFYLFVRAPRERGYVVDLRHVDPAVVLARQIPWGWIAAGTALLMLAILGVHGMAESTAPWWAHERLFSTAALFGVAAAALYAAAQGTAETLTLFSAHGRAKLLTHAGGRGTFRAFRMFLPHLEAHLRIAGARRRAGADHLRDEMREHFRLREAGALTEAEYETAKRKILATHGLTPAAGKCRNPAARTTPRAEDRRPARGKLAPPPRRVSART